VCACSSQSWRPCQSCEASGWKVVSVCRLWGGSSNSRECGVLDQYAKSHHPWMK